MVILVTNYSPPTEGIKHEQPMTKAFKSNEEIGTGTLFVAESELSWRNDETGDGFSIEWPQIGVHAVSRDLNSFASENIYVMITKNGEEGFDDDDELDLEDPEFGESLEIRFVPEDNGTLDAIFSAMKHCQSLNPDYAGDSDDEFLDADEEGEYILAGGDSGYIEDMNNMQISNGIYNCNDTMEMEGQFEDAEDDEED